MSKLSDKKDLAWFIKWVSSFIVITAMSLRGIEGMQVYDLTLSIVGVAGWLCVGMLWKDRALIILNDVGLVFLFRNLLIEYLEILLKILLKLLILRKYLIKNQRKL